MKINTTDIQNDINLDQARRAYDGVSFRSEQRGQMVVDSYIATLTELALHIDNAAAGDERMEAIAQETFDRLRATYKAKTLKWLGAQSRCLSSMIAGPANFPVRRAEKANAAERARGDDLYKFGKAMHGYADKALAAVVPKAEKMDNELTAMQSKLAGAEKWQDHMKKANALNRKKDGDNALREYFKTFYNGNESDAVAAYNSFKRGGWWGEGFAPFEMTNNLANIKRMRERVATMEKRQAAVESDTPAPAERLEGLEIVRNAAEDRLQLIFDGKPSEQKRAILKRNGFKWSPRWGAWQRQLTANAESALRRILPELQGAA